MMVRSPVVSRVPVRILLLALLLLVVHGAAALEAQSLSLLDVRTDAPAPPHVEVPAGARFFRIDIYLGDAPPRGMWPEDFDGARQGGKIGPILVPDRDDAAPLGDRTPLVMVHGIMLKDAKEPDQVHPEKAATWDTFRTGFPSSLRRKYKPYFFLYPTSAGPRVAGRELARLCRNTLADANRPNGKLAFVSHSMGGLTIRYAMNENKLGDQVVSATTIATPHHGSVLASLFPANVHIKDKIGWFRYAAIQATLAITPYPAAVDEIAYDNVGHEFEEGEARRMGIRLNSGLAEFNRNDPYLKKVTALMADLRAPRAHFSVFKMLRYVPGYIVGPLSDNFRSLDPLVHYESGCCEANSCPTLPLRARKSYEGVDHSSIMASSTVMGDVYSQLGSSSVEAAINGPTVASQP